MLAALALLCAALGAQSYRLKALQGEHALYVQEHEAQERERQAEAGRSQAFNAFNKWRTDEEHKAALARARAGSVRVDEDPGSAPGAGLAGGSDEPVVCYDRGKLEGELAGFYERNAARLTAIAVQGEAIAADARACSAWALGLAAWLRGANARQQAP